MKIKEALRNAKKTLRENDVAEPDSSAEFLMGHILGGGRTKLYQNLDKQISAFDLRKFNRLLAKRKKHQPVWQITGSVPFWGLDFMVNKNVLVPRPETEFLVKKALGLAQKSKKPLKILDIGTGAGPIAISLAKELLKLPQKHRIFASDISLAALQIAKRNARNNQVADRIIFKKSDLFRSWGQLKFDIVCANLPYIPHGDMPTLALDIHHFEPRIALDGGAEGLEIYEEFFRQLPANIEPGGYVFCEIGIGQGLRVSKIAKKYFAVSFCKVDKDFSETDRLVTLKLTKSKA